MVSIFLNGDWGDVEREVRHLEEEPDRRMAQALDAALDVLAEQVRDRAHVITGSLRSSVKASSRSRGRTWEGEIEVGGVSAGVNNPVDYAWYEQRREGPHDFMEGVKEAGDALIGGAIEEAL